MTATSETITTRTGGWHTARVHTRSAATGTVKLWDVTWRTQHAYCHNQPRPIIVADNTHLPVWADGSYGNLRPRTTQCGTCGTVHTAHFDARRVS